MAQYIGSITDLMTIKSRTPAECYVYRKPDAKVPALQRSAMSMVKPDTAPTEWNVGADVCYRHVAPNEDRKMKLGNLLAGPIGAVS